MGALFDPCREGGDLVGGERVAFGGHDIVAGGVADAVDEGAFFGIAGDDGGAVALAATESGGAGVEVEAAFDFGSLVAGVAVGFEDGLDFLEVVDGGFAGVGGLGGGCVDAVGDEVVDFIVGGES